MLFHRNDLCDFKTCVFPLASKLLLLLIVTFGALGSALAERGTLRLETSVFRADLAPYTWYLEDPEHKLNAVEAASIQLDADFKKVETPLVDFGFTKSKYWLKIRLKNSGDGDGVWKLTQDSPMPDPLEVYLIDTTNGTQSVPELVYSTSIRAPFFERVVRHRHHVSNLELRADQEATLLIGYASGQTMQIPLMVETDGLFYERIRLEDIQILGLLALIIGMATMNVIYLAALGMNTAYFYGAYIFCAVLYLFHADGHAFQYFWPNSPNWNVNGLATLGFITLAVGNLFAWSFINARRHHPRLNILLPFVSLVLLMLAPFSVWFIDTAWYKISGLLFASCAAVLPTISGVIATRNGHPAALLYTIGTLVVCVVVIWTVYGYLNPGQFNQDAVGHVARYALLFEAVVFSMAIFVHTQIIRRERDTALFNEIALGKEKLALSESLRHAEIDYGRAVLSAETQRKTLATTAHDMRQPLSSLRMKLMQLQPSDGGSVEQLNQSFDYLDEIITQSLDRATGDNRLIEVKTSSSRHLESETHSLQTSVQAEQREVFQADVVLRNVGAMFREDARAQGIAFKVMDCSVSIRARPLDLMRMLSNLTSNALVHSKATRILLGCRRVGDHLLFQIHDNGIGMDDDEVRFNMKPENCGEESNGNGLGLSIVDDLAKANGLAFTIKSERGRGTVCEIKVPVNA